MYDIAHIVDNGHLINRQFFPQIDCGLFDPIIKSGFFLTGYFIGDCL